LFILLATGCGGLGSTGSLSFVAVSK